MSNWPSSSLAKMRENRISLARRLSVVAAPRNEGACVLVKLSGRYPEGVVSIAQRPRVCQG